MHRKTGTYERFSLTSNKHWNTFLLVSLCWPLQTQVPSLVPLSSNLSPTPLAFPSLSPFFQLTNSHQPHKRKVTIIPFAEEGNPAYVMIFSKIKHFDQSQQGENILTPLVLHFWDKIKMNSTMFLNIKIKHFCMTISHQSKASNITDLIISTFKASEGSVNPLIKSFFQYCCKILPNFISFWDRWCALYKKSLFLNISLLLVWWTKYLLWQRKEWTF